VIRLNITKLDLDQELRRRLVSDSLECLSAIIANNISNTNTMTHCCVVILPQLVAVLVERILGGASPLDDQLIGLYLKIVRVIAQGADESTQTRLISDMSEIFLHGSLQRLPLTNTPSSAPSPSFKPLSTQSSLGELQLSTIFASILTQSKQFTPSNEIVHAMLNIALDSKVFPSVTLAAAQCVASIVNKMPEGEALESFVSEVLTNRILSVVVSHAQSLESRLRYLSALVWITKGLVQRNHLGWQPVCRQLVGLLSTADEIGATSAHAFNTILEEDQDDVLTKASGAVVRVLYKQKFFNSVFPDLLSGFKSHKASSSSHLYLVAISNLLKHVPKSVLLSELQEILPVLVQSLSPDNGTDAMLYQSTLTTITLLARETPESIADHASSLLPLLLNIAVSASSMMVRKASLHCIKHFANLPYHKIFPLKNTVVVSLQKCLDDKKRMVRKEAVKARNQWFSLSST